MLKKLLHITLFALLPVFGYSQSKCDPFKNGTFKVTDPASKKVCIITRDGNIQTEKMEDDAEVYDFDIVWLDDCTYTVSPTAATAARNKDTLKAGTMTVVETANPELIYAVYGDDGVVLCPGDSGSPAFAILLSANV